MKSSRRLHSTPSFVVRSTLIDVGLAVVVVTILITSLGKEFVAPITAVNFAVIAASVAACLSGIGLYLRRRSMDHVNIGRGDRESDLAKSTPKGARPRPGVSRPDIAAPSAKDDEIVNLVSNPREFGQSRRGTPTSEQQGGRDLRQQTITICFFDIEGSTKLFSVLGDAAVSEFMHDYYELAADVIAEQHGILDKFIGDGVMALFGAPSGELGGEREGAENAVQAAFKMRQGFDRICSRWELQWKEAGSARLVEIGFRCAIHTGVTTLISNPESVGGQGYTAIGRDIYFAARLVGTAKAGQILVSRATKAWIENSVELRTAGPMAEVKNIPGGTEVFMVIGSK